jgi:uncharacterized protein YndB with AHSA1/START domain
MKRATGKLEGEQLQVARVFAAPIEDVWASLTQSERTAAWYGPWTGAPGKGRTISIKMLFEDGQPESVAYIDACEPPRRLAISTAGPYGVTLELTLTEVGSEVAPCTELQLLHRLTAQNVMMSPDFAVGWEYYLDKLVAARAGAASPRFEDYLSMRAHYAQGSGG